MSAKSPITDNLRLMRVLNHLKAVSFNDYYFSVCALQTGAYLGDLLGIKISDVTGTDYFTNKRNGFRFYYDDEMLSMIKKYISGLPEDTVYLFPSKRDRTVPMSIDYASKQLRCDAQQIGETICHMQFVKTFAFNYFIEHGNLKATGLCQPGTDIPKILNYLCMTSDEYNAYKNHSFPESECVYINDALNRIEKINQDVDNILHDYAAYIKSGTHDPIYESNAEVFFAKLGMIIDDFQSK